MSENILVVEYEPRYTDRVRAALAGQPINAQFAKDGEEAMKALEASEPNLIVMSSVVPKISAPELIRAIRGRGPTQQTPILLTVSGYSGNAPKQDAVRMGASDILAKPYSESEFLGKVQQLLGVGQLTSKDIFGDVLSETAVDETAATPPAGPQAKKTSSKTTDIDAMLDATLASVLPKKAKTSPGTTTTLDKKLQDTLSGLEKSARKKTSGGQAASPVPTGEAPVVHEDKVPVSQPVFPAAVPPPEHKEEEEPADGVRFGQYVLQEKIATGGMAEVWKARMRGVEGFQKTVAIKKILPHLSDDKEFIEMFVDEAKLAAQLNHNNIIHIYDLGKIANSYYIAMEYVDGHDLKTILKRAEERHNPMTVELALFIASKVASALDYAHRKRDFDEKEMGLVHRDVSPQNVLVSEDGDIKLCDFGIAKAASKASHTQAGALKGKLQYMSPEQAWARPIDRRSDIFALATVLYEMITGRKLFTGDNEISILEQVREARVEPPSKINEDVTPEIDRIVLKALAKDPADRYQTAGEMARDIDSLLYSFRPTPTSADLAIYMHHLWSAEPVLLHQEEAPTIVMDTSRDLALTPSKPIAAPTLVDTPVPGKTTLPGTTAPGNVVMPAWDAPHGEKNKSMTIPIAAGVVIVLAAGGGFLFLRGRSTAAPATKPASVATTTHAAATPPVAPVTTASVVSPAPAQTTASAAPVPQAPPALDPNAINEEVQKRLAAERARLEDQQRRQLQQQQQQPAARQPLLSGGSVSQAIPQRPAPPPVQQAQTQPVAPPVQTNTEPPPQTQPTATQAVATQAPAPLPTPRVREGDLVAPGADGLVPARILSRGAVPYPPMARQEHIDGTVLLNVLVNENGQVLDIKVVRGRPAGLNEAAIAIVRRSKFSAPTKDGVRVKSWTTVPVDFKL